MPPGPRGKMAGVEIARSVVIRRSIEEVFAFVADARNDPRWCPKVLSVEQLQGDGPGPGARLAVAHRPIPLRPPRQMDYTCVAWTPPRRIEWRENDGTDVIDVTYELEALGLSTRLTQRDDADLGAPRMLQPLIRIGIGLDIARQLRALKELLESAHGR